MINITDIIQGKFMEEFSAISMGDMLVAIALSFALSLLIVFIYRITYAGVSFSAGFAGCIIMLSMVTTVVILVISSNVVLSLGMVGALSIVRFRTAIKEPLDIAFLFWSIVVGIMLGAGMIPLAVFSSVILGVILLYMANRKGKTEDVYILVLQCANDEAEKKASSVLEQNVKQFSLKSKTVSAGGIEWTVEVRIQDGTTQFINQLYAIEGVASATLVSYNGEYMA
jgi:uncharacterized membrane protein YhiD involved in acid resistance